MTAQITVQASPAFCLNVIGDNLSPPAMGIEASLYIIDHLFDAAACTLAGFMFQKVHNNLSNLKTTNKNLSSNNNHFKS